MTDITTERIVIDGIGTIGGALYAGSDKRLTKEMRIVFTVAGGILGLLLVEAGQSVLSGIKTTQSSFSSQAYDIKMN